MGALVKFGRQEGLQDQWPLHEHMFSFSENLMLHLKAAKAEVAPYSPVAGRGTELLNMLANVGRQIAPGQGRIAGAGQQHGGSVLTYVNCISSAWMGFLQHEVFHLSARLG